MERDPQRGADCVRLPVIVTMARLLPAAATDIGKAFIPVPLLHAKAAPEGTACWLRYPGQLGDANARAEELECLHIRASEVLSLSSGPGKGRSPAMARCPGSSPDCWNT